MLMQKKKQLASNLFCLAARGASMHNLVQSSAGAGSKKLECLLPSSDNTVINTFTSRKLHWNKFLVVTHKEFGPKRRNMSFV